MPRTNGSAPVVPNASSSSGPAAHPPNNSSVYTASTRPRVASALTVLIQVSPTSHGRISPIPERNRRSTHHQLPESTGIRAKVTAMTTLPATIARTGPMRAAIQGANGTSASTANDGALPPSPTSHPSAPHAASWTVVIV